MSKKLEGMLQDALTEAIAETMTYIDMSVSVGCEFIPKAIALGLFKDEAAQQYKDLYEALAVVQDRLTDIKARLEAGNDKGRATEGPSNSV